MLIIRTPYTHRRVTTAHGPKFDDFRTNFIKLGQPGTEAPDRRFGGKQRDFSLSSAVLC